MKLGDLEVLGPSETMASETRIPQVRDGNPSC